MTKIYIYALWDEVSGEGPRYIGQSIDPHDRFSSHKTDPSNKDKLIWMRERIGLIKLVILDIAYDKDEAKHKEKAWIALLKPRYNLIYSTTRKFRYSAGRVGPFKTLPATAAKPATKVGLFVA